jgi:hypothetical protein
MLNRLIELAIEALESKKAAIDAEIAQLREGLRPARSRRQVRARRVGKKSRISAAARKALSERMTARWAKWRAERAKTAAKARKPARRAKTKPKQEARLTEEKES